MDYFESYFALLVFICVAGSVPIGMLIGSFFLSPKKPDEQKQSTYECGFEPSDKSTSKFHVHFYLVSILFILFDLEIAFLFPWSVNFDNISDFGFYSMMVFLVLLTVGFVYEWKKGALQWD